MSRLRVNAFGISLDGYGAGPRQSLENPLGVGGMALHEWVLGTKTFKSLHGDFAEELGRDKVSEDVDDKFAARGFENLGAWIMGRNMFTPERGPWRDPNWKGWWGDNPPYHVPVFVLTHHAHAPIEMAGGTVFHFVTGGIRDALERATAAAQGKDVEIGGGVATVRQYLEAKLIDELHVAIAPLLLGSGEHLFHGLDLTALGYRCTTHVATAAATPGPSIQLDLRGLVCPGPTVATLAALKRLSPGRSLIVTTGYPPARQTIPRLVEERGYTCVFIWDDGRTFRLEIVRGEE